MRWLPLLLLLSACPAPVAPRAGGDCPTENLGRCDTEAPRLLQCLDGTWAVYADCKGPRGCALSEDTADCDTSGNTAGDRCPPTSEGLVRCDPDAGANILRCIDGTLDVIYACMPPSTCGFKPDAGLSCW